MYVCRVLQVWYVLTFTWLKEIRHLVQPWVWIPALCTRVAILQQLASFTVMVSVPGLFFWRRAHESLWRMSAILALCVCAGYTKELLTTYLMCTETKGVVTGKGCPAIVVDGMCANGLRILPPAL